MILFKLYKILNKTREGLKSLEEIPIVHSLFQSKLPHRQLSFIGNDGWMKLQGETVKGFCHLKFRPNFVIEDRILNHVCKGQRYSLGSGEILITEVGKECYPHCNACSKGISCNVNHNMFFAVILKEGHLKLGDPILQQRNSEA